MSRLDALIREGMAATLDLDDIDRAMTGPDARERSDALMRLLAGSYKRGWDDCDAAYKEGIVRAGLAFSGPEHRA